MRIGARTILRITVAACTTIVGFTIPVPRSPEPRTTIANCSAIPGMNQWRKARPASRVASSAPKNRMYGPATAMPPTSVTAAQSAPMSTAWLNTWFASARFLRPTACDTIATVPTPSICDRKNVMNMKLPAALTPAIAASPSFETK